MGGSTSPVAQLTLPFPTLEILVGLTPRRHCTDRSLKLLSCENDAALYSLGRTSDFFLPEDEVVDMYFN